MILPISALEISFACESAWLIAVIKDSSKPTLFGKMAQMPKYEGKLTDQQIADLADFNCLDRTVPQNQRQVRHDRSQRLP